MQAGLSPCGWASARCVTERPLLYSADLKEGHELGVQVQTSKAVAFFPIEVLLSNVDWPE
jgi:hypothetical protein